MNVFLIVFSYILIPILAFVIGYRISHIRRRIKSYSGTMKVIRDENKVLYSLELSEDPSMLEQKSEVIFKVDTSD
jgi:phosphate/sulfate permease